MSDEVRAEETAGGAIELRNLSKDFDGFVAVDAIDLRIRGGEFFSLLGPSGCGKTTTLRLVAGFERPSAGAVLIDGADLSQVPAHRRNVNTVFQSYALFPHLDVLENVAYGLRWQRLSKADARRRATEALDLVQLGELASRRPPQLSGGQQQRVALARALVLRPAVLLLDEPLGALDAKIRKQLRIELKALQEEVGITFLFVTHDQEEALSMSDRIGVMNEGRIDQIGTPQDVYETPTTVFVADFLGVANLMSVEAVSSDAGGCELRVGDFRLRACSGDTSARGEAKVVVRPERVEIRAHDGTPPPNCLPGMVDRTIYVGSNLHVVIRLATGALVQASIANTGSVSAYSQGDPVLVHLPDDALRLLTGDGDDAARRTEAVAEDPGGAAR
ncbi:MAG TPA: ABC transporter ATP-binding protein [Solirubrobacterales bacterium]|nr:ABC transporter ATP-binding protein [Solirubrobacterales bacterium]